MPTGNPAMMEWLAFHREQFFRYLLTALQNLTLFYQAQALTSRPPTATPASRSSWLPVEETAHRQLMSLVSCQRAPLGRPRTVPNLPQRVLWEELAVEPAQETELLYEHIKQGLAVELAPTAIKTNPVSHLTAFVGREPELQPPEPSCTCGRR
jgi:hypothetical protein